MTSEGLTNNNGLLRFQASFVNKVNLSITFSCTQNMKLVTNKFKSGGLHEKHVVATCNLGNHLSICL